MSWATTSTSGYRARHPQRQRHGCRCPKPQDRKNWVVTQYRCNHSAFNGYKRTPSEYSTVRCLVCGHHWRTKAAYVDSLQQMSRQEAYATWRAQFDSDHEQESAGCDTAAEVDAYSAVTPDEASGE